MPASVKSNRCTSSGSPSVQAYLQEIAYFPLLTPDRERELASQVRLGEDAGLRLHAVTLDFSPRERDESVTA